MKAVVWTDVFQSVVMIAGLLAIVIQVSFGNCLFICLFVYFFSVRLLSVLRGQSGFFHPRHNVQ